MDAHAMSTSVLVIFGLQGKENFWKAFQSDHMELINIRKDLGLATWHFLTGLERFLCQILCRQYRTRWTESMVTLAGVGGGTLYLHQV